MWKITENAFTRSHIFSIHRPAGHLIIFFLTYYRCQKILRLDTLCPFYTFVIRPLSRRFSYIGNIYKRNNSSANNCFRYIALFGEYQELHFLAIRTINSHHMTLHVDEIDLLDHKFSGIQCHSKFLLPVAQQYDMN
jgi:hypothetical protein